MDILDEYVKTAPGNQAALDLFKGEWSSAMPAHTGLVPTPGSVGLFEDGRIAWAEQQASFFGKSVLELGPLEGGHSYMIQKYGARSIKAVESNSRAFLKCLIVKQIFNLDRVEFVLGDFNRYLETTDEKFDVCVASGVLYHCTDPVRTLAEIAKISRKLFLWTHYYDHDIISASTTLAPFFEQPKTEQINGSQVGSCRKNYNNALEWQGFCGGSEPYAIWLERNSLMETLRQNGFGDIRINFDQPDHPNGPALALFAQR
ncbi:MAG: class I SAM-dependent methyltransferase [Rhizobiaceae bacterium]